MNPPPPPSAAERGTPASKKRGGWRTVLKLAIAIGLLAFVGTRIPWRDQLSWRGSDGSARAQGVLEGDWKAAQVRFRPTDAALPGFPDALRKQVAAGETLARGGGLDWQPGLPRVFGEVRPSGLALALALLFTSVFLTATRWWKLLHAAGVRATWYAALRLTSLGLFFNLVVPGLTGGDLIKAVLVARENPGRREAAVVSVLFDRLLGLFLLLAMGASAILYLGGEFARLRVPVLLAVGAGVVGVLMYTSRALRRLVRFDALLAKLPGARTFQRIDEAALLYSSHPGTLAFASLLSIANHLTVIAGIFALGRAFGDARLGYVDYLALSSVANTATALPIAPGGWGVGEAVYGYLFKLLGAGETLGVAVSVSYRLCMMVIGLCGGVFLLLPGARAEMAEIEGLEQTAV